jgi:spermidine/putrescine transport system ATP-binding protein
VAVESLSLAIQEGEFFSLLGPSGCGKTTTLRVIGGFEHIDTGDVYIDGRAMGRTPPNRRATNMVFQRLALFPHYSVYDNVAFGLRMQRLPDGDVRRRVGDVLELVQLTGLDHRRITEISGGQQQRVALGRALMIEPPLLLLDEPFAALDGAVRESLQADVAGLQRELGVSVVYITHNLMDAFALGDRLAVIQAGCLQQVGPIQEVFYHPNSRTVAQITGVRNLLEGEVRSSSPEGLVIAWKGHTILAPPSSRLPGEHIAFYIRPEDVKLLYPDRPLASAVQHNRFMGRVLRILPSGSWVDVRLGLDEEGCQRDEETGIESRLPMRAYLALGLEVGAGVAFSLRRDGIMLLPRDRETRP